MTEIVKPIERHRFMCPLGGVQLHWSGSKVIRKITKSGNNNSRICVLNQQISAPLQIIRNSELDTYNFLNPYYSPLDSPSAIKLPKL